MAVTSWTAPTAVVSERYTANSGTTNNPIAWTNPGNATANDGSNATCSATTAGTEFLRASGFGFSIPGTAQIDGIEMRFERITQANTGTTSDHHIYLCLSGDPAGANRRKTATWPTSIGLSAIYGTPYDTWGIMLTPGDVNDSDFGCVISALPTGSKTVGVDYIEMRVHYTDNTNYTIAEASPGTIANNNGVGTAAWSNTGNVGSDNNSRASGSFDSSTDLSQYLHCTNYGFSIPSGQEILAIQVIVTGRVTSAAASGGDILDNRIRLIKGGSIGTHDKANATTGNYGMWFEATAAAGDQARCYGDTILDLWADTWTHTDINASNFGAVVAVKGTSTTNLTAEIDNVRIRVKYQPDVGTITGLDDIWGCLHWYKGDALTTGSGRVTQMDDKTGNSWPAYEVSGSGGTLSNTLGLNSNKTGVVFNDDYYDIDVNIGQNGSVVAYGANLSNPVTSRVDWMYNSQEPDGSGYGASFWTLNDFVVPGQRQVEWGSAGGTITSFRNNTTSLDLTLGEYAGMCWLFDRTGPYDGSGTTKACIGSRPHDRSLAADMALLELAAFSKILSPGERAAIQAYFVAEHESAGGTTHHGIASLSCPGTITTIGKKIIHGVADYVAAGTISVTAKNIVHGASSLVSSGDIVTTGGTILSGISNLSAAGTLSSSAGVLYSAISNLNAEGILTSAATMTWGGVASLVAAATLASSGGIIYSALADLSASGVVTTQGRLFVTSTTSLVAAGSLTSAASLTLSGIASLDLFGNLSAAAGIIYKGVGLQISSGLIDVVASITRGGAASLIGTGALSTSGNFLVLAEAALDTFGLMSTAATLFIHGVATLDSVGSIEAAGSLTVGGAADLVAVGLLEANVTGLVKGLANLLATGQLSSFAGLLITGAASITGAGTVAVSSGLIFSAVVSITGASNLSTASGIVFHATSALDGAGSLTALGQMTIGGLANLASEGLLSSSGSLFLSGVVDLTGTATLDVLSGAVIRGAADLIGAGTFDSVARMFRGASINLDAVGTIDIQTTAIVRGVANLLLEGSLSTAASMRFGAIVNLMAVGTQLAFATIQSSGNNIRGISRYLVDTGEKYETIIGRAIRVVNKVRVRAKE